MAIVALAKGPVSRARLTDLLWGDRGEEQAKASLRQALYELRDLSSSGLLTVSRESVELGPKRLWTDVGAIYGAIDPAEVADHLQDIQWPLLSDLDDVTPDLDEWLRAERTRVSGQIVRAGTEAAEAGIASGDAARQDASLMRWRGSTRSMNGPRRPGFRRTSPSATDLERIGAWNGWKSGSKDELGLPRRPTRERC